MCGLCIKNEYTLKLHKKGFHNQPAEQRINKDEVLNGADPGIMVNKKSKGERRSKRVNSGNQVARPTVTDPESEISWDANEDEDVGKNGGGEVKIVYENDMIMDDEEMEEIEAQLMENTADGLISEKWGQNDEEVETETRFPN